LPSSFAISRTREFEFSFVSSTSGVFPIESMMPI